MDTPEKSAVSKRIPLYEPFSAVLVTVGAYFGSQVFAATLLSLLPLFTGWNDSELHAWLDTVVGQFIAVLLIEASILGLVGLFMYTQKIRLSVIGIVRPRAFKDVSYALVGYAVYFAALIVITMLAKAFIPEFNADQEQDIFFNKQTTGPALALIFFSLVVLPPLTEEIIVRGFLFTGLRKKLPFLWAGITTSALFGAAHLQWGNGKPLLWIAALDTFVLSLILVYLREKTQSLWPCIFIHMIKNAFAFYLLFVRVA